MMKRMPQLILAVLLPAFLTALPAAGDDIHEASPDEIRFFETKVRPILVDRCFECHSAKSTSLKAALRLDSRMSVLKGGDSGPAVNLEKVNDSLLLQAVRYESYEMPPDEKLSDAQIADLEKWIQLGAPWPKEEVPVARTESGYDWKAAAQHWAFQAVEKPNVPHADSHGTFGNPIDAFIFARLQQEELKPSPPAAARIFVRRAFLDLIGLPPKPDEMQMWVAKLQTESDALSDDGVAQLIDDLLARPQYGERWGRHWLDVARYSEIGGWTQDNRPRPQAWQFRDWVIGAFNDDMPYDEFVRRQIAGDHIASESHDRTAAVGTGFFALGPAYSSDGGDPESKAQAESETLDDRVDTFSRAFLGLTVACARCHDHKFDPIPTQDYYSIAGIFRNSREGETPLADQDVVNAYHAAQAEINALQKQINDTRNKAKQEKRQLSTEEMAKTDAWQKDLDEKKKSAPPKFPFAHTIHDSGSNDMKVALRGNLLKPGDIAPRRFLRILAGDQRTHFANGSGRKQLAAAVTDPTNPLTARVFVNRVWMNHFGRALVRTPGNFGTLGETPTHPELLDWLAATFVESGWSIKSLHRRIMTSTVYRSASTFDSTAFERDGDNRFVWRMNPRRMDVETWRDSLLAVTGELDETLGGTSVDNIVGSRRRTLYAKVSRNAPQTSDVFLRMFDFPIPRASSSKRTENVIPQQFLFMMNSPFMLDRARALAARLTDHVDNNADRIEFAYQLLYGRLPTSDETSVATDYLQRPQPTDAKLTRLEQYCQVLLSSNEFMFVR